MRWFSFPIDNDTGGTVVTCDVIIVVVVGVDGIFCSWARCNFPSRKLANSSSCCDRTANGGWVFVVDLGFGMTWMTGERTALE